MMIVTVIEKKTAIKAAIEFHYLHRKPPISFCFGLWQNEALVGIVTFGVPPSRHLQMSACPTQPDIVLELNRLWVHDDCPRNTESWFVSRTLGLLPPRIIVSYADPVHGHMGYIYRALNFNYAGWTDMERKTPRFDYLPENPKTHTRDAFRNGYVTRKRRVAKVKYWIVTGDRRERRDLNKIAGWPRMSWITNPPPAPLAAKA